MTRRILPSPHDNARTDQHLGCQGPIYATTRTTIIIFYRTSSALGATIIITTTTATKATSIITTLPGRHIPQLQPMRKNTLTTTRTTPTMTQISLSGGVTTMNSREPAKPEFAAAHSQPHCSQTTILQHTKLYPSPRYAQSPPNHKTRQDWRRQYGARTPREYPTTLLHRN